MQRLAIPLLLLMVSLAAAGAQEVPRMTKEELKGMLGDPDVIIIDVRSEAGWNSSDMKIKGAVREDPWDLDTWMAKYPRDKTLVFYCA